MKRVVVGGVAWTSWVIVTRPSPFDEAWARALLLLAPFVLVPLGLALVPRGSDPRLVRLRQMIDVLQLPAAACLAGAFTLERGIPAALLGLPWLATTGLVASVGLLRLARRGPAPLREACIDAGLIYVVIGAAWAVADRLGFRPLDFDPVIVLLTAIHFHYAGFALPLATGVAMRAPAGRIAGPTGVGVITGVPLVAIGITTTQLGLPPFLESLSAWYLGLAGMGCAWTYLRLAADRERALPRRFAMALVALSLAASMVLAALYGTRFYLPLEWLDIPLMRALHGTANALGFGLVAFVMWSLEPEVASPEKTRRIDAE